jgi:hypothetical protein
MNWFPILGPDADTGWNVTGGTIYKINQFAPSTGTTLDNWSCSGISQTLYSDLKPSISGLCEDCISIFESDAYEGLVDVKNRQTLGSYPRLRMALDRYIYNTDCCVSGSTALTYENTLQFSKLLNPRWMEIIEEMVPSTSIWNGSLVIRNTIFDQQKFKYKDYGLNAACGGMSVADFNLLTEGTDYINGGSVTSATVEINVEQIFEDEPKCKSCEDKLETSCGVAAITKIGAEHLFMGEISSEEILSLDEKGDLVLSDDPTAVIGSEQTFTNRESSGNLGIGNNNYIIVESE